MLRGGCGNGLRGRRLVGEEEAKDADNRSSD